MLALVISAIHYIINQHRRQIIEGMDVLQELGINSFNFKLDIIEKTDIRYEWTENAVRCLNNSIKFKLLVDFLKNR